MQAQYCIVLASEANYCTLLGTVLHSKASETTLSVVYKFELVRSIYIYIWRYVCHNSSACHAYVMWEELGHSHFLCASHCLKRGVMLHPIRSSTASVASTQSLKLNFFCIVQG